MSGRRNNIRGPARERGISTNTGNLYRLRNNQQPQPQPQINEDQVDDQNTDQLAASSSGQSETPEQTTSTDNNSNSIEVAIPIQTKKKNPSKGKKRKIVDSEDEDDAFEEGSFGRSNYSKKSKQNNEFDYIRFCKRCNRRYHNENAQIENCDACCKISSTNVGAGLAKKKRQAKGAVAKKGLVFGQNATGVNSLRDICIDFLAENISLVEELGDDVSSESKLRISKILSRQRKVNLDTLKLFLGVSEDRLDLFDCANLSEEALKSIAYFSPYLETLKLKLCGRINDNVINLYSTNLLNLTSITLSGCYLVTETAFKNLFSKIGSNLRVVALEDAVKLTASALEVLVSSQIRNDVDQDEEEHVGQTLKKLILKRCSRVGEDAFKILKGFNSLECLKIHDSGNGEGGYTKTFYKVRAEKVEKKEIKFDADGNEIEEDDDEAEAEGNNLNEGENVEGSNEVNDVEAAIDRQESETKETIEEEIEEIPRTGDEEPNDDTFIELIKANGNTLLTLSLEGFFELSDNVLINGILPHCSNLRNLSLASNCSLTKQGLSTFFNAFQSPNGILKSLNLTRQYDLSSQTLQTIANIHHYTLETLILNGAEDLNNDSIKKACATLKRLRNLDLSWCREVDSETMMAVVQGGVVNEVGVWGCHKVAEEFFDREWRNLEKEVVRVIGNEFV